METITLSKMGNGELVPTDKSYRVLGVTEYSEIGRVITRASGIYSTFRYNVSRIVNEKSDRENIIYELVADGIDGTFEENVFKFTGTSEEVISKLNELIDKM